MARTRPFLLVAAATLLAACNSVHNELSRQLLQPPPGWLAEPADLGIAAEPFEVVLHSEASMTGWWIPSAAAHGRTVVLMHDERTNASVLHPYYSFLHEAGFNVAVLDPRGFGKSKGTPSMYAWLYDLPKFFDWLEARPDVDARHVALYGTGLGSVAAMWAVMARHGTAAIFENLPSLHDMLRDSGADGQPRDAFSVSMLEFAGLPEDIEAEENAKKANVPALFVTAAKEPSRDRLALLRGFAAYAGAKELWVIPDAGQAPSAMLIEDGQYQRRIVAWLEGALGGASEHVDATPIGSSPAPNGGAFHDIKVTATPVDHTEPWAVEVAAIEPDGNTYFAHTWLEHGEGKLRVYLPQDPIAVSATRIYSVLGDEEGGFQRHRTDDARAALAIAPLWPRIEALRTDTLHGSELDQFANDLLALEAKEPFPPRLSAELADVFARLGKAWANSDDAQRRAQAKLWFEQAVAAEPAKPKLHVWQGVTTTYGFPQAADVEMAKQRLRKPGQ